MFHLEIFKHLEQCVKYFVLEYKEVHAVNFLSLPSYCLYKKLYLEKLATFRLAITLAQNIHKVSCLYVVYCLIILMIYINLPLCIYR